MKKIILVLMGLFNAILFSQNSIFDSVNQKNIGHFDANANLFYIHRSDFFIPESTSHSFNRNAASLGLTLNYKSPDVYNFYIKLSYLQTLDVTEYSNTTTDASLNLQNSSFGILNNLSFNYNIQRNNNVFGTISIGRFPLDNELMTGYRIRQKLQAYEGAWVKFPKIKKWSFQLGYLTKFSSWRSFPKEFRTINTYYSNDQFGNKGFSFGQIGFNDNQSNTKINGYYAKLNPAFDITGVDFLQQLITFNSATSFSLRTKSIFQWNHRKELTYGIQPGIMLSYKTGSIEAGSYIIEGKKSITNNHLENPFGAKLILSEPLMGTGNSYNIGSRSYYIEGKNKWKKTQLYYLYLQTKDGTKTFHEFNVITSYNFNTKWSGSLKGGLLDGPLSATKKQILDFRWVLNYIF